MSCEFRASESTGCTGNPGRRESADARGAGSDRRCATELRLLLCARAVRRLCHQSEYFGGTIREHGAPVLTLVDDRNWYVLAYFREDLLDRIRPGMRAEVSLLSYPGKRFQGEVEGIGWGLFQENGATVSGLPNVEETLNWVRLNQRFPVRIVLKRGDSAHPFRMGQTAVVTIRGDRPVSRSCGVSSPERLAPSHRRIIEAARNAAKCDVTTGLAAMMQIIGPFGPLFAFRIGQPGISSRHF